MVATWFMVTTLPTKGRIQLLNLEFSDKSISLKSNRYPLPATNLYVEYVSSYRQSSLHRDSSFWSLDGCTSIP